VISQREAKRLKKRIFDLETELQRERRAWAQEYIGGVEIARAKWNGDDVVPVAVRTARKLKHAVVVTCDDDGLVRFHALLPVSV
jgi:hypothetical protein